MPLGVVHFGTGNTGKYGLAQVLRRPDLELVGLGVNNPDKVGVDAGTLAGEPPVGVVATDDLDALVALKTDCLAYYGDGIARPAEAVADMCRFLEAGTNVVTTSLNQLVYPPTAAPELRDPLAEACRKGASSFFNNGADPGFGSDLIPVTLLSLMDRVDSVRIQEIVNYGYYDQPDVMRHVFGFGQPLDYSAPLFTGGALTAYWGGVVTQIARILGTDVDSINETHEVRALDRDVETAVGTIESGTVAAIRFEVQAMVGSIPMVVVEHVTRIDDRAAPEWPLCRDQRDCYQIHIAGSPNIDCELKLTDDQGNDGGLIATAARVVNAIPAVCKARPDLLSFLDIPMVPGL
jgi:4-hydroxy-tetrahydrodipicolinate reductase